MIIHDIRNKNKHNRKYGVTLVELLIVVSIIAIISLAIIPSYVDFAQKKDFNNKTETIISEIMNVRNKALAGAVYPGTCTTTEVNWGIQPSCALAVYSLGYQCPAETTFHAVTTQNLPTSMTFDSSVCDTIVFQRLKGTPIIASGNTKSITLKYKGSTRTITVNTAGRIIYN